MGHTAIIVKLFLDCKVNANGLVRFLSTPVEVKGEKDEEFGKYAFLI